MTSDAEVGHSTHPDPDRSSTEHRTVEVDTPMGRIRARRRDGVVRATGIRFAHAERFAPCSPVQPWIETVDATRPGPACPQLIPPEAAVTGSVVDGLDQSEDCLTLTVTAPESTVRTTAPDRVTGPTKLRPVMVWIHGGTYLVGSGESDTHDPTAMVREQDIVVVTISYRLGIFGFLSIPDVAPANLGLGDQIAALRWVARAISGFGGDPARVTVVGQSAGADSIAALMAMDSTRGLFGRAILQSGPFELRRGSRAMTAAMGEAARGSLGPDPASRSVIDVLIAQTVAQQASPRFGRPAALPFGPEYGADSLPRTAQARRRRAARATDVDVLIGWTADDGSSFVDGVAPLRLPVALPVVGSVVRWTSTRAITEVIFAAPARRFATAHRAAGGRVRTYEFGWRGGDPVYGACHSIELPFLFGDAAIWEDAPMLGTAPAAALAEHGPTMRRVWADVVRDGIADADTTHLRLP